MKAIFLDRDGTIIVDKNYLKDPGQIEWMPGAIEGLKLLHDKGYELFLVTNQSGIGRGFFSLEELNLVHQSLNHTLEEKKIGKFKDIQFCPHSPEDQCLCRKPKSGMITTIMKKYKIDLTNSWMIGDKDIDALCALEAKLNAAIIGNQYQTWAKKLKISYFDNVLQFAQNIS